MIRNPLVVSALLAVSVVCLHAQQTPPGIKAEFRMLAFTSELKFKDAYVQDPLAGAEAPSVPAPIKTYLNHQFIEVELKSRKFAVTTKPDHDSITRPGELIGEATLPDGVNSAILVFLPGNPDGKSRCQILVIDDSKSSFPAGSFCVTNLNPLAVRLLLEKTEYKLAPGTSTLIVEPPVREGQQSGMRAFHLKDDKWEQFATGFWSHPGDSRGLKLLYQNPATGNVDFKGFDDVPPRQPKDPAATSR